MFETSKFFVNLEHFFPLQTNSFEKNLLGQTKNTTQMTLRKFNYFTRTYGTLKMERCKKQFSDAVKNCNHKECMRKLLLRSGVYGVKTAQKRESTAPVGRHRFCTSQFLKSTYEPVRLNEHYT